METTQYKHTHVRTANDVTHIHTDTWESQENNTVHTHVRTGNNVTHTLLIVTGKQHSTHTHVRTKNDVTHTLLIVTWKQHSTNTFEDRKRRNTHRHLRITGKQHSTHVRAANNVTHTHIFSAGSRLECCLKWNALQKHKNKAFKVRRVFSAIAWVLFFETDGVWIGGVASFFEAGGIWIGGVASFFKTSGHPRTRNSICRVGQNRIYTPYIPINVWLFPCPKYRSHTVCDRMYGYFPAQDNTVHTPYIPINISLPKIPCTHRMWPYVWMPKIPCTHTVYTYKCMVLAIQGQGTAYVGLARPVYTHRIWPYVWLFPCPKYRAHTVYTYKCMVLAIQGQGTSYGSCHRQHTATPIFFCVTYSNTCVCVFVCVYVCVFVTNSTQEHSYSLSSRTAHNLFFSCTYTHIAHST